MMERQQSQARKSPTAEIDGLASLVADVAVPFLIASVSNFGAANVVGASVFSAAMLLLHLTIVEG